MCTSAPDHLYLSPGLSPLSKPPQLPQKYINTQNPASLQLLYALIGRYHIIRRSKHAAIIDNRIYPPHLLKSPTVGYCEIALRPSTDPYYEVELIQSTTMNHKTHSDRSFMGIEKRAFRIREGEWSVWAMEEWAPGCHRVGGKLADLVLWDVPRPCLTDRGDLQIVHLTSQEEGGEVDGFNVGVKGNFAITLWLGARPCWEMKSQVGVRPEVAEVCHDEFWPMIS